jgi:carbamate kinase
VAHEAGRGWRRVVPSPEPLEIVELEAVRTLIAAGTIAVACGGGGIPVSVRNGRLSGVDAVIDKDRASSVLAIALFAERLVIVTDVEALSRGWGTSAQEEVRELDVRSAEALLPELATGSMGPKLEAALAFARTTGHNALITSAAALAEALAGRAGTRIKP